MARTAAQRFDVICPEFKDHADKAAYLEMADELTSAASSCGWNDAKRTQAVALRAAHMMTLSLSPERAGGTGGQITQKREGQLSLSFGGNSSTRRAGDLDQTSYGIQLQALISGSFLLIGTTGDYDDC